MLEPSFLPGALRRLRAASGLLALAAGVSCSTTPPPAFGVIVETSRARELGVSTRFGIVSVGAEQDRGEVVVTAFYGDGPATEPALIEPVADGLCRIRTEFPTPWCEITSVVPVPGEELTLAGYTAGDELWTRTVQVASLSEAGGLLVEAPSDLEPELLLPGAGLFRWETDRWRLVGLLIGTAEVSGRSLLLGQGPIELARFVLSDHQRHRPPARPYRQDVRPR